ncbi:transposase family protein [Candidatus Uabimicrobium sp. HlEnr_7]|uniref:transposase family protein n=1 Tax=Candidatus Uabimicrobium helgolandensis TaxID=3095367 RepID=UPI0035590B71
MLKFASFFPDDFKINTAEIDKGKISLEISSFQRHSFCPLCKKNSRRIHSYYYRKPMDLPILGNVVYLIFYVRKFFCDNANCERHIFEVDIFLSCESGTFKVSLALSKMSIII